MQQLKLVIKCLPLQESLWSTTYKDGRFTQSTSLSRHNNPEREHSTTELCLRDEACTPLPACWWHTARPLSRHWPQQKTPRPFPGEALRGQRPNTMASKAWAPASPEQLGTSSQPELSTGLTAEWTNKRPVSQWQKRELPNVSNVQIESPCFSMTLLIQTTNPFPFSEGRLQYYPWEIYSHQVTVDWKKKFNLEAAVFPPKQSGTFKYLWFKQQNMLRQTSRWYDNTARRKSPEIWQAHCQVERGSEAPGQQSPCTPGAHRAWRGGGQPRGQGASSSSGHGPGQGASPSEPQFLRGSRNLPCKESTEL